MHPTNTVRHFHTRLLALIALGLATSAAGAEVAQTLMPPAVPVAAGTVVRVDLVAVNPGGIEMPFEAPASLSGEFATPAGPRAVTLVAVAVGPASVPATGYAVRRYEVKIPADASGQSILAVATPAATLHAVFAISPTSAASPVSAPVPTPLQQLGATNSVSSTLVRTFAGRLIPNMPVYFIYGSGSAQAVKFQLSFDYRLATLRWGAVEKINTSTLRLGYTQRSLWDIKASSSPFYDTSYMPEVAVNTDVATTEENSGTLTWIGWRAGVQHESNGRDGSDSRSLNTIYFRPRFMVGSVDSWHVVALPELYAYLGGLADNENLKDYRGYGKIRAYLARGNGLSLMFTGWTGKDFDHATYQLDLALPVQWHRLDLESFIYLQYFNGYGESLRDYEKKSNTLRIGVSLVR